MPPNNSAPPRGLTSSMSTRAFRAESRPQGSWLWTADPKKVWGLVEVVHQENTILTVRRKSDGETLEIDLVRDETQPSTETG